MDNERRQALTELPLITKKKSFAAEDLEFLLGAEDREMQRIREILETLELNYTHATCNGFRVHADNAYKADPVPMGPGKILVLVECEPIDFVGYGGLVKKIDHHNETDKGYHMPANLFWQASSLGQLYEFLEPLYDFYQLGIIQKEDFIIAARDHCMFDALRDKCPGVTAEDIKAFGRQAIAQEKGVPLSEIEKRMSEMSADLAQAPRVAIGDQSVIDFRKAFTGIGYTLDFLLRRETLAHLGQPGLIRCKNHLEDRDKVMIFDATPTTIRDFTSAWGQSQNLESFFQSQARRYAGGFIK